MFAKLQGMAYRQIDPQEYYSDPAGGVETFLKNLRDWSPERLVMQ